MFIFVQFYCFEQKGLFTTSPIFPLDLLLFKLIEKKELSEYFWASFWVIFFLTKKRSFQWYSPKMFQNNRKAYFSCMWLTLRRKTVFVNICPLLLGWSKQVVKRYPNFPQDWPLFKLVKKNKLSEYFCATFWDTHCYADGLSRLPQETTPRSEPTEVSLFNTTQSEPTEVSLFNIGQFHNLPISYTQVRRATRDDPYLSKVYSFVRDCWPGCGDNSNLHPYWGVRNELLLEGGCLLRGIRVVIPPTNFERKCLRSYTLVILAFRGWNS